jgi:hypothetical protein
VLLPVSSNKSLANQRLDMAVALVEHRGQLDRPDRRKMENAS